MRRLAITWVAAAAATTIAFAQLKPGDLVDPRTVWVHATVADAQDRLVTGLTREDFEVRDSGVLRPVTVFNSQLLPFSAALMLDTSGSLRSEQDLVRRAADAFVARFIRGDRVVVGTFAEQVSIGTRFWANRGRVLDSVSDAIRDRPLSGPGGTHLFDALELASRVLFDDEEALTRVILLVTDGKDRGSSATEDSVAGQIGRANALLYAIGITGSEGVDRRLLTKLAAESGGAFYTLADAKRLAEIFTRIVEELHGQYLIGFVPSDVGPGRRQIAVSVKRSGLSVRAQRTYDHLPIK